MKIKPNKIFCRSNNGFSKINWQTLALFWYFQIKNLRHWPIQFCVTSGYRLSKMITNRTNHKIRWLFSTCGILRIMLQNVATRGELLHTNMQSTTNFVISQIWLQKI